MPLHLTEAQVDKVRELQIMRAEAADLKSTIDDLRDELLAELVAADTDQAITASGSPAMHIQIQHRRKVNAGKLEALYPNIYEEVFEESETRVLKIDIDDSV